MYICMDKYEVSDAIVRCLRGECVMLVEMFLRRDFGRFLESGGKSNYRKICDCINDEEL